MINGLMIVFISGKTQRYQFSVPDPIRNSVAVQRARDTKIYTMEEHADKRYAIHEEAFKQSKGTK